MEESKISFPLFAFFRPFWKFISVVYSSFICELKKEWYKYTEFNSSMLSFLFYRTGIPWGFFQRDLRWSLRRQPYNGRYHTFHVLQNVWISSIWCTIQNEMYIWRWLWCYGEIISLFFSHSHDFQKMWKFLIAKEESNNKSIKTSTSFFFSCTIPTAMNKL